MDNKLWDISKIFTYKRRYQEHCDDEVIYYKCTLLIDFGPFKAGYKCNITIDSGSNGRFTMNVDCDGMGAGGELFIPVWTHTPTQ